MVVFQETTIKSPSLKESFIQFEYLHLQLIVGHNELSLHLAEITKCPWRPVAEKELWFRALFLHVGQPQWSQTGRDHKDCKTSSHDLFLSFCAFHRKEPPFFSSGAPTWSSPADLLEDVVSADVFNVFLYDGTNTIFLCQLLLEPLHQVLVVIPNIRLQTDNF